MMKSASLRNLVLLIRAKVHVGSCAQLVWSFIIVRQIRLQDVMTVRLDAAEELVIRCTEHVR